MLQLQNFIDRWELLDDPFQDDLCHCCDYDCNQQMDGLPSGVCTSAFSLLLCLCNYPSCFLLMWCFNVPGLRSPRTSSKFCLGTTACNVTYLVNEMRHFSKDLTPGNRLGTCQLLNMIHLLLKGFFFFFLIHFCIVRLVSTSLCS